MTQKIYVWDPIVRVFHWSLVILFTTAYFTGGEKTLVHQYAGYIIFALLAVRLLWGLVGTRHARFSDFVRPPRHAIEYIKGLAGGQVKDYVGHNPAGGWMVIALLVSLSLTGIAGLMVYGTKGHGPLAPYMVSFAQPTQNMIAKQDPAPVAAGDEDEDGHEKHESAAEEILEDVHDFLANFTLFLIGLHLAGVVLSSYRHRQNLVRAMVTGYKEEAPH
jgi:cytochrome b